MPAARPRDYLFCAICFLGIIAMRRHVVSDPAQKWLAIGSDCPPTRARIIERINARDTIMLATKKV